MGVRRTVLCAALFVGVLALSASEVSAVEEEAQVEALAGEAKWVYVPDTVSPGALAKKAAKIIQQSKKGQWVKVPEGKRASEVAEKLQLKKTKQVTTAKQARGFDRGATAVKKKEKRLVKREAKSSKKKKQIMSAILDAKKELKMAKAIVRSAMGSPGEKGAIKGKMKAKAHLIRLESKKLKAEEEIQADLKKKRSAQMAVSKADARVQFEKAKARREKMQYSLMKAYKKKNPVATQDLLIKFAGRAKAAAEELGEIKRRETQAFDEVKSLKAQIRKQESHVRSMRYAMNPKPVKLKIAELRARLAMESKTLANVKTKEIDAKDKLSALNVKYEMVDQHEKGAVSKLQHGFVVQARKRSNVEKEESGYHKDLAKSDGTLTYAAKEKLKYSARLAKIKVAVKMARAATAKERKAKSAFASHQEVNSTLVTEVAQDKKKIASTAHQKNLVDIKLKVADLAVKSKKLAYDAAEGDKKVSLVSSVMEAKSDLEKVQKSKTVLGLKVTGLKAQLETNDEKEKQVKGNIAKERPGSRVKVNLEGPELQMELAQKALMKYSGQMSENKKKMTISQETIDRQSPKWKADLRNVKATQSELVKEAKKAQSTITADKTKEAGAKKAVKILDGSQEKIAKKISTTNDAIMDAEDDLRKTGLPARVDELNRAQAKLKKLVKAKYKAIKKASKEEGRVSQASQEARLTKMGMTKAGYLEKDLSAELKSQEVIQKDATKKNAAVKADEKNGKREQIRVQKAMLKRHQQDKAKIRGDRQAASVQLATAGSLVSSLEADLAASRSGAASAETAVRKATTTTAQAEDKVFESKAAATRAAALIAETKKKHAAAVDEMTAAKKAGTIAKQKAAQAEATTKPAESELKIDQDALRTAKQSVIEKAKEVSTAKKALQKGKDAYAKNKAALAAAWTKSDKVRLTATVQENAQAVTKLSQDLDVLEKRHASLKAMEQSAMLKIQKSKAELDIAMRTAHAKKESLLSEAAKDMKTAAAAKARSETISASLANVKLQFGTMKQASKEAKRRYARDKRVLSEQKSAMKKYTNKEQRLVSQTASAKVNAAKLKEVNAIKIKAAKVADKAALAKIAETAASAAKKKEKSASTTVQLAESKEESTESKISSLKRQIEEANKRDKKVADTAFAAATQPTAGIARKSAKANLKKRKLGEAQKAASKGKAQAKSAAFIFVKAKKKYRTLVKSHEKLQKIFVFRSSERSIKGNNRRSTQIKGQDDAAGVDISNLGDVKNRDDIAYDSAKEHLLNVKKSLKASKLSQTKLKRKLKVLRVDQQSATAELSTTSGSADIQKQKEKLVKLGEQIESTQGSLKTTVKTHKKLKKVLALATVDFTAAKRGVLTTVSKINHLKKYRRKLKLKLKKQIKFGTVTRQIKKEMEAAERARTDAKRKMSQARDVMEESKEESSDLDRSRLADSLSLKNAKADLASILAAQKAKESAAAQATKNEEAQRLLKKELVQQNQKLAAEKNTVKSVNAEDAFLAKLKKQTREEAQEKKEEAKAALNKEEEVAANAETKTAKVDAKEGGKVSKSAPASFKAQEAHIENLVDAVDIPKLIARSKRALAKKLLERQGKPVPKDPNPEPLSDKELKVQRELKEKKLKFMKKEEIRKVRELKAAQRAAAMAKEQGIVKEAESKAANKKAVKKAEEQRIANNMKTLNDINDARAQRDKAENRLARTEAKWETTVERGDPAQVKALALKLKVAKARMANQVTSIKTLKRQVEDVKTAGANKLVEAKAKAASSEERVEAKIKMAADKASSLVKKDAKKAEAVANKVEKDKKKVAKLTKSTPPKNKEDWQKAYENVVSSAKPGNKPGKSRSQERSEKAYAVIQRAELMITKIKKLNEMSKDKSKAPTAEKGKTNQALNAAKAKELAGEAEKQAEVAATAAKNVAALTAQPPSKDSEAALAKAKAAETAAKEAADALIAKAKVAAKAGGKESNKLEKKAEAKAKQTKLKAKAEKEKAKAEKAKVEAKKKETEAATKAAEEKAKAAKGSGDKKAAVEATKKADKAKQKEKLAKIKADAKAVPATDKTAVAAKADAAAAKVIEKTTINDIPEVSSLHTESVKAIAKARFAELIASGDIKVPTNAKTAPVAAAKEAKRVAAVAKP